MMIERSLPVQVFPPPSAPVFALGARTPPSNPRVHQRHRAHHAAPARSTCPVHRYGRPVISVRLGLRVIYFRVVASPTSGASRRRGGSGASSPYLRRAPPRLPPRTPRGAADDPRARPARRPRRATRVWCLVPTRQDARRGSMSAALRHPGRPPTRVVFRLRRGVDGARHPRHLLNLPGLGFLGGARRWLFGRCHTIGHLRSLFPLVAGAGAWPGTRALGDERVALDEAADGLEHVGGTEPSARSAGVSRVSQRSTRVGLGGAAGRGEGRGGGVRMGWGVPTAGCGFEEAWAGCLPDGHSPGRWGRAGRVLRAGCGRGICEHASLSCAGRWRGGRVSRREGASAVSGSGTALTRRCTGACPLGHRVHQLEPQRGVQGTNVGSGRSMTPAMTDCEARALVRWIGPSSETQPKYASDVEQLQPPTGLLFIVLACTRRACRALDGARALRRIVRDARPSAFSPSPRCGVRRARRAPSRERRFSRGDSAISPAGHRRGRRDRLPTVRGGCHQRRQRHPSPQRHVHGEGSDGVRRTSPPPSPSSPTV